MLSWAAADLFTHCDDAISVHACHPGEVATLEMAELNLADGLRTPAQAAAVPSFLAADQRLDAIGTGPYYWNSRMRLKDCEYMGKQADYMALWKSCEKMTGVRLGRHAR